MHTMRKNALITHGLKIAFFLNKNFS